MNEELVDALTFLVNSGYVGFTAVQGDVEFSDKLLRKAIEMGVNSRIGISQAIDDLLYLEAIKSL